MTSSGFPFDFGRNAYKGKRPLKDIIGSYKNRHSSGDPVGEGVATGSGPGKPAPDMQQLQVQSQQEELERLKKDLASQKVTCLPWALVSTPAAGGRASGHWGKALFVFPRVSLFPEVSRWLWRRCLHLLPSLNLSKHSFSLE